MKALTITLIFLPIMIVADWKVIRQGESNDCYLSWLQDDRGQAYVLKQIKDLDPSEQFLLVVDATANRIGRSLGIAVNRVKIIPAETAFPGKKINGYPATLHTEAGGKSAEEALPWNGFTVHQRYRKPGSRMEKRWGPIPPNRRGLTIEVMENISHHEELQKIVALDTFVGNSDRSLSNIFYDVKKERFCGIDMAASFSTDLAFIAYKQLTRCDPKIELAVFLEMLHRLYRQVTPDFMARLIDAYADEAGFRDRDYLNTVEVRERATFHKRMFRDNYKYIPSVIKELESRR
ncbi:MAG: hypothetical protein AAGE99_02265 [Chlamydiota bacterium]